MNPCGGRMRARAALRTLIVLSLVTLGLSRASAQHAPPRRVAKDHARKMTRGLEVFKLHVRPLLRKRCLKCHGGKQTKGQFDLRTRAALLRPAKDGSVALVPGNHRASALYRLIAHQEEPFMPHKEEKLLDAQIARIAEWIDLGAPYDAPLASTKAAGSKEMIVTAEDRNWWAFQPLQPSVVPPVKNASWCRTPIDFFVLARLEVNGLRPSEVAEYRVLVRRAYLDLHGVPPSPAEMAAALADTTPGRFDRLIDRLLSSPRFGERWGSHWLDVARFAESHGFEHDTDRKYAYHYRDFVIRTFNQDLPYDTFVRWQVAGDELEPENPLAMMATGFLGAGVFPTQITKKEVERTRYDALDDMAATLGSAMLGLTVGCARCHDHKFDPIPTRDYYRLISTFTTTVRSEVDLDLDPTAYRRDLATFQVQLAPFEAARDKYEEEQLPRRFQEWLKKTSELPPSPGWILLEVKEARSKAGATFAPQPDGSLLVGGNNADFDVYTLVAHTQLRHITGVRLEALAHPSLVRGGPGRADNGNIGLSRLRVIASPLTGKGKPREVKLVRPQATFQQNMTSLSIAAALDDKKRTGWAVDPQFGKDHAAVFETASDVGFEGGTRLEFILEFDVNNHHNIGRPRLSVTGGPRPIGLKEAAWPAPVARLFKDGDAAKLSPQDRDVVLRWYRDQDPGWRELNEKVVAMNASRPKPRLTKVMICSEGVKPMRLHTQGADFFNETHFLHRGDTDQKRGVAQQGFLQVLMRADRKEEHWQVKPPQGARTSYRRRSLANWLVDTEKGAGHLLARVIVNRTWQHHLGRGIVSTPNDFGFQGERPTHPELLDWLAGRLIESGWRLSVIHKLIMTSAVYMQAATDDPALRIRDPRNRWLWRWSPRRLEAEAIRDSMLTVSESLDTRMFGAGTLDESMRRRSIYFTIKRSRLIPMLQLFDAPEPLVSIGARPTTTIAPQALLFMNHREVRRFARAFAARILPFAERSLASGVDAAYEIALVRPPNAMEREDGVRFIEAQRRTYAASTRSETLRSALADFCQVAMSLNEFIYMD